MLGLTVMCLTVMCFDCDVFDCDVFDCDVFDCDVFDRDEAGCDFFSAHFCYPFSATSLLVLLPSYKS